MPLTPEPGLGFHATDAFRGNGHRTEPQVEGEHLQLGDRFASSGPQPAVTHSQTAHFLIREFGVGGSWLMIRHGRSSASRSHGGAVISRGHQRCPLHAPV